MVLQWDLVPLCDVVVFFFTEMSFAFFISEKRAAFTGKQPAGGSKPPAARLRPLTATCWQHALGLDGGCV